MQKLDRLGLMPPLGFASLALALGLAGCTTFSPDAGMGLVTEVAGQELRKDALAVRTEEDALRAR